MAEKQIEAQGQANKAEDDSSYQGSESPGFALVAVMDDCIKSIGRYHLVCLYDLQPRSTSGRRKCQLSLGRLGALLLKGRPLGGNNHSIDYPACTNVPCVYHTFLVMFGNVNMCQYKQLAATETDC